MSVQIIPPTRLLLTGMQEATPRIFARRPAGTNDWLMIYTEEGCGYFRSAMGEFLVHPDDVVLIRPGVAHHYGMDERHGRWRNRWTHFLPRPDCLEWLRWPEFAPGMARLRLGSPVRELVKAELGVMERAAGLQGRRQEELAVNALERALLLCDTVNPGYAGNRRDPRVSKALELLCHWPAEPFSLSGLARRCGLSRSRLAQLFKEQAGVSPLVFLETRRLRRVRDLLEYTGLGLGQIAEDVGFSSPYYLSLRFKRHFGVSPREYRREKGLRTRS